MQHQTGYRSRFDGIEVRAENGVTNIVLPQMILASWADYTAARVAFGEARKDSQTREAERVRAKRAYYKRIIAALEARGITEGYGRGSYRFSDYTNSVDLQVGIDTVAQLLGVKEEES